jgi:hypothetical protein
MFLAAAAAPRRRWGCVSVLFIGLLFTAGGLWMAFRPAAVGNDRDLDRPVSPHPPTDLHP